MTDRQQIVREGIVVTLLALLLQTDAGNDVSTRQSDPLSRSPEVIQLRRRQSLGSQNHRLRTTRVQKCTRLTTSQQQDRRTNALRQSVSHASIYHSRRRQRI